MFTASDPSAADHEKGVGIVLRVEHAGDAPIWQAGGVDVAVVAQAEGDAEARQALAYLTGSTARHRAVVTTLGIDPAPFVKIGVTSCMVECYAQAGDEPYGDLKRMAWQARHDGWPHAIPVLGVYDGISLSHYFSLNGGAHNFKGGHWRGGPLGIYLAEGMTDTDSWGDLAAL